MSGSQVSTGAKLVLTIGAIPVAYATNVSYTYSVDMEPVKGIDDIPIKEYAETGVTVRFTASTFRIAHNTCVTNGWMPKLNVLLQQPELTAFIKDRTNNTILLKIFGLKCIDRSGSVNARGTWTETLTFVGTTFIDEAG